jgi:hypothetical protein
MAEWTCDAPQIPSGQVNSTDQVPAAGQTRSKGLPITSSMPRPAGDHVVLTHSRGPLAQVGLMLGLLEQELPAASPGCLPFHQAPPTRERPDSQMARRWIR